MKCHYEILGVERDADDKAIKNAYRKLALKFHPDKNPNNIEEAKSSFLLVQQAYEVLSDPHERAWYDNHRDQILRGSNTDYEDTSLDVFPYFTVACFKGFGDDEEGFYAVYGEVFEKIATEDIEFMDSPEEYEKIPKFGTSTSDYETVVGPFYAHWQSYCTKKSYAWLCPHNITEIRDRRILREIEKETKKIAQKARKERNDEVRALVAFVRKRDKRYQEYKRLLEQRAEENRQKQNQRRLAQLQKNQREAEEMRKNQQNVFNTSDHEEQLRQLEQTYGSDSSDEDYEDEECDDEIDNDVENEDDEDEYYVDDLYCVACNKSFKNASSYENHESSKKHKENLARLERQMKKEEENYQKSNDDENDSVVDDDNESSKENEAAEIDTRPKQKSKKSKKSKNKIQTSTVQVSDDEVNNVSELDVEKSLADVTIGHISDDSDDWTGDNKKGKKSKQKKTSKNASSKTSKAQKEVEPQQANDDSAELNGTSASKKSQGKAKKNVVQDPTTAINGIDIAHACVTCHATFESKNKLFNHLKKTNHGVYIPKGSTTSSTAQTAGGKRGKK